ncbi:hypothetical protein [Escherichia coli]|uniref:hypothetical protein n=1 Tax=Escherichia coli TaxID=562 RepID=UPI0039A4D373
MAPYTPLTRASVLTPVGWPWQPELEKYDYRSARQYVTGTLTGPDFARGLANVSELDARQRYPLAIRSPEQARRHGRCTADGKPYG